MESGDTNGDSVVDFKGLRITQLDDSDDEIEDSPEPITVDEVDDYDEDEEDEEPVTLGFVEKPKSHWSLLRQLFPHKAGGGPAWLDPVNLPSGRSILCDMCEEPLQFVLQVYAPRDKESAFHRTLFLFMCPSMSCLNRDQHEQWKRGSTKPLRSVKVFRSQLPRDNPFYSSEPPKHDGSDEPLGHGAPLCSWCGTWKGDKLCSNCKRARYCSQRHQVLHWRSGHKNECQQLSIMVDSSDSNVVNNGASLSEPHKVACKSLWQEYEIINVEESEYDMEMSEDEEDLSRSLVSRGGGDDQMKSLMSDFEGDADKKSWASFQERLAKAPGQVLRYCPGPSAKPLWPMASGRLSKADIPRCRTCNGPLCFEFQVLPPLLYYFNVKNDVDSLDWATIAVYTCENSCDSGLAYKEEFPWVQLYTQTP